MRGKLGIILRQYSKPAGQRAIAKDFFKPYQLCCLRFEELDLNVPILSTYETEESRSRTGRLKSRRSALVSLSGRNLLERSLIAKSRSLTGISQAQKPSTSNCWVLIFRCVRY